MENSFGRESTNPRTRRAYAQALINLAIGSGKAEDKLRSVEAANAAAHNKKGHGLGAQAVQAVLNHTELPASRTGEVITLASTKDVKFKVYATPRSLRTQAAVSEALGVYGAITIESPSLNGHSPLEAKPEPSHTVITEDFSVPGMLLVARAATAITTSTERA